MTGQRDGCPRTRGLIDRIVAGSVSDEDQRHAATCPTCGPAILRAARFDDELERTAQHLIAEDLPRGILDPDLGKVDLTPRLRLAPSAATGFATLAFVVLATAIGIRPVLLPGTSPTPPPLSVEAPGPSGLPFASPLWSVNDLTVALAGTLDYDCMLGTPATPAPGVGIAGSVVCTAPSDSGPFTATVLVDASDSGMVVHMTITADIIGASTPKTRDAVATALAKVTAQAFTAHGPSVRAANFVFTNASLLSRPAWAMGIDEGGVRVDLERRPDGGYTVNLSVAS